MRALLYLYVYMLERLPMSDTKDLRLPLEEIQQDLKSYGQAIDMKEQFLSAVMQTSSNSLVNCVGVSPRGDKSYWHSAF